MQSLIVSAGCKLITVFQCIERVSFEQNRLHLDQDCRAARSRGYVGKHPSKLNLTYDYVCLGA